MTTRILIALAAAWLIALPQQAWAWGGGCDYSEQREQTLDAASLTELMVSAKAGELTIKGEPGRQEITANATVCASSKELLAESRLNMESNGRRGEVSVELPRSRSWGDDDHVSMDLELRVPDTLELDVDDSSGELEITNVASLKLDDSSGSIYVRDVRGDLSIEDSSGSLKARGVGGAVTISDSSGSIDVSDVLGSVLIERDTSGSIEVSDVGGDFTVGRDGSGGIDYRNVAGRVDVPKRKRDRH